MRRLSSRTGKRVIGFRKEQLFATMKTHAIGGYTDAAWKNFISVLHAGGQLKSTDIPVDQLYDGSFVEAFNKLRYGQDDSLGEGLQMMTHAIARAVKAVSSATDAPSCPAPLLVAENVEIVYQSKAWSGDPP